jgi:hypothetical protein
MRPKHSSHPLKLGDAVAVFGLSASGRPYLEGLAQIRSRYDAPHFYRVRFKGERVLRTRFINPNWQRNPERSLALLLAFWDATASPSFDEFFPHDRSRAEGTAP